VCARFVSNSRSLSIYISLWLPSRTPLPSTPPSLSVTDGGHICSPIAEELKLLIAQQLIALRRVQGYLGQDNSSDLRVLDDSIGMCAIHVYIHTYVFTDTP
jgi:hypothetical protein